LNTFKKTPEKIFDYVKKFNGDLLQSLYKSKDIPTDVLMIIIRAIKSNIAE
jgi:hypothetical protein